MSVDVVVARTEIFDGVEALIVKLSAEVDGFASAPRLRCPPMVVFGHGLFEGFWGVHDDTQGRKIQIVKVMSTPGLFLPCPCVRSHQP